MKMLKMILVVPILLISLFENSQGDENKPRTLEDLEKIVLESEAHWDQTKAQWRDLEDLRRNVVEGWSLEEIEIAAKNSKFSDWREACLERWGTLDPQSAVGYCLATARQRPDVYDAASRELEGGINGLIVQRIGLNLNEALSGWARKDSKAAWEAANDPKGEIKNSRAFADYGYLVPIKIFRYLSAKDPGYAIAEFEKHQDLLFRQSMLEGMSVGLPKGHDWKDLFQRVAKSPQADRWAIVVVMRGAMLGRWMENDADAAVKWFRSPEGEVFSVEVVEERAGEVAGDLFSEAPDEREIVKTRVKISVAEAVRYWLSRDREGAIEWLKVHPELVPEILEAGTSYGSTHVRGEDLRMMLVKCLGDVEREELLSSLIGKEALSEILDRDDQEEMKRQIEELRLRYRFGKELFEKHLRDEADPVGE